MSSQAFQPPVDGTSPNPHPAPAQSPVFMNEAAVHTYDNKEFPAAPVHKPTPSSTVQTAVEEPRDYFFYSNPNSLTGSINDPSHGAVRDTKDESTGMWKKGQVDTEAQQNRLKGEGDLPPTLFNPTVRRQLAKIKTHKPVLMWVVTALQIAALIASCVLNYVRTGSPIQTGSNFNYFIGPAPGVLISMGARFTPCLKPHTSLDNANLSIQCFPGSVGSSSVVEGNTTVPICTLADTCGLSRVPDQFYRFLIAIFLHGGIVHLAFNLLFQLRTGLQMERDWGSLRVGAIYFISGIAGFIFGGNYAGLTPSVGCSGALYGLIACLLIDLFQNWRLIMRPWLELLKMVLTIVLSLMIGFLPYIDNFAHVGGFVTGIFAGLLFMPTIHYGTWDRRRKFILMVLSVPVLVLIYYFIIRDFYGATGESCTWCKYINCLPGLPWCEEKWSSMGTLYNLTTTTL